VAYLVSSSGIRIKIVQGKFGDVLSSSKVIIGLSGMGNEQAVGLGKPVVSFPTPGPPGSRFRQAGGELSYPGSSGN